MLALSAKVCSCSLSHKKCIPWTLKRLHNLSVIRMWGQHNDSVYSWNPWTTVFAVFLFHRSHEPYFYLYFSVFATRPVCAVVGNGRPDTWYKVNTEHYAGQVWLGFQRNALNTEQKYFEHRAAQNTALEMYGEDFKEIVCATAAERTALHCPSTDLQQTHCTVVICITLHWYAKV